MVNHNFSKLQELSSRYIDEVAEDQSNLKSPSHYHLSPEQTKRGTNLEVSPSMDKDKKPQILNVAPNTKDTKD
jgi:hypothetical protein